MSNLSDKLDEKTFKRIFKTDKDFKYDIPRIYKIFLFVLDLFTPTILNYLSDENKKKFLEVVEILKALGNIMPKIEKTTNKNSTDENI